MKRQVITRGHPRSTFTEEGYYSDRVENIMSDAIEARLSKLYKFANEMMDVAKPLTIPSDIYEIAIDYFRSLIARSPILAEAVSQRSALIQCVNKQTQRDMIFYYAMQEETMFKSPAFGKMLDFIYSLNLLYCGSISLKIAKKSV